jgi:ABC-2 type transport system permease protein
MIRLIRAEFTKLTTTRLIYGLAAAMAAFAALTVVVNVTIAGQQGNPPLSAYSLPVLVAGPVTLLSGAALLLGILGMAGEFRHQTVTQIFLVTPDRGRVVAAKLVAYPLAGIALTLTILAFTAAVATGWLAAKGITPSLLDARLGHVLWALGHVLLGAVLAAGLCALIGVGVAALVRNQVAALVGVAVWVLVVEGLLMSLLNIPSSLAKWFPSAAAAALTNPGGGHLSRLAGALLLAAYALALAAAGTRLVLRRDIT